MWRMWRSLLLAAVLVVVGGQAVGAAGPDDDAAQRAAREITAARNRANETADQLWAAQSQLEVLRDQRAELVIELERLEAEVDDLRTAVEAIAVGRFVAAGASGIPLLTDVRAPNDRLQADVFAGIIADVSVTTLDDFDEARTALEQTRSSLDRAEDDSFALQARLEQLRQDAESEVERLRALEEQRLQDEAVQRALEAQRREEQRQAEERLRAEEAERRAAAAAAAAAGGPSPAAVSGGDVGGRTGGGGGGSNPGSFAPIAGSNVVNGIVCPVQGASAFGDTWGAPRSGGRRHQGVDMLAPIGTPLQAVVSGMTEHRSNTLGGITVSLRGDNGDRYYYAHLDRYQGGPGRVQAGQVIGYVGQTGNAYGTPHLHFEIRPGGGVPVNPTPAVVAAGC